MTGHRSKSIVVGMLAVVALALLFLKPAPRQEPEAATPSDVRVEQLSSYIRISREEMIDESDAIFLGKVVGISPTRWNQDSGEEWYDSVSGSGLQLHTIEFEVLEPIVDTIGLGQPVTITVLGSSPLEGSADHDLKVDDQAVIFARAGEIAWRGGTMRPVWLLTGAPSDSHLILGDNGLYAGRWNEGPVSLEQLISRIAQRRDTLVQP
jgi:hypothetical protein